MHVDRLLQGVALSLPPLPGTAASSLASRTCLPAGYREWPLLEDLDLVQRLAATAGRPAIIPTPIRTSGRRWARLGLVRTTLVNQAILLGHALGVDPATLAGWYRRAG